MNFKQIFMMSQNVKKTTINTRHARLIGRKDESKHIINTYYFFLTALAKRYSLLFYLFKTFKTLVIQHNYVCVCILPLVVYFIDNHCNNDTYYDIP